MSRKKLIECWHYRSNKIPSGEKVPWSLTTDLSIPQEKAIAKRKGKVVWFILNNIDDIYAGSEDKYIYRHYLSIPADKINKDEKAKNWGYVEFRPVVKKVEKINVPFYSEKRGIEGLMKWYAWQDLID